MFGDPATIKAIRNTAIWIAVAPALLTGLGFGARLAHRSLSTPRAWQVLDVLIGLTMLAIAAGLAAGG